MEYTSSEYTNLSLEAFEVKQRWDRAYTTCGSVMGTRPNDFFVQQLSCRHPGVLLLPGEGEGRHAIYAARRGWLVDAFDISEKAHDIAMSRARSAGVSFKYWIDEFAAANLEANRYDLIALIDVFPLPSTRKQAFARMIDSLKPGGYFVFECFSRENLRLPNPKGPKDPDQLYAIDQLKGELDGLCILQMDHKLINRREIDVYPAYVIQLVGQKCVAKNQGSA